MNAQKALKALMPLSRAYCVKMSYSFPRSRLYSRIAARCIIVLEFSSILVSFDKGSFLQAKIPRIKDLNLKIGNWIIPIATGLNVSKHFTSQYHCCENILKHHKKIIKIIL